LREQLRGAAQERRNKEAAIASTPVSFAYASQGLLGSGNTFGQAASVSWGSAQTMLGFVALLAGIALPWLLLLGTAILLYRSADLRRLLKRLSGRSPAVPAQTE
jgi:hypothetical protein